MEIINWKLISHPMNWVVFFLMFFIASLVVHFLLSYQVSGKVKPS